MEGEKRYWGRDLITVASGVCGLLVGLQLAREDMMPLTILPLMAYLICVCWVLVRIVYPLIHAIGRSMFGTLSGYGFCGFGLGPVWLVLKDGKLRLRCCTGPVGQIRCILVPPEGKRPYLLYCLGGSILTGTVAVVCLVLWAVAREGLGSVTLLLLGLFGLVEALAWSLPIPFGPQGNDGWMLKMLRKDPAAREDLTRLMRIQAALVRGLGLMDIPEEWLVPESGSFPALRIFQGRKLTELHRFTDSVEHMEKLLEEPLSETAQGVAVGELLFAEIMGSGRLWKLCDWYGQEQKRYHRKAKRDLGVIRTEYAIAVLWEKDTQKAQKLRRRYRRCAIAYPCPGIAVSEGERMALVDAVAAQREGT